MGRPPPVNSSLIAQNGLVAAFRQGFGTVFTGFVGLIQFIGRRAAVSVDEDLAFTLP
jgi:hypothetical protein